MTTATTPPDALRRAQCTLKNAYLMFDAGCALEAIEACRSAGEEAPAHFLPPTMEGALLLSLGRVRAALGSLRKTVRRFPDEPLPRFHFAEALLLAGRNRRGLEQLDAAEALSPQPSLARSIEELREVYGGFADEGVAPRPFEVPD